jgi:hypothetical protein
MWISAIPLPILSQTIGKFSKALREGEGEEVELVFIKIDSIFQPNPSKTVSEKVLTKWLQKNNKSDLYFKIFKFHKYNV